MYGWFMGWAPEIDPKAEASTDDANAVSIIYCTECACHYLAPAKCGHPKAAEAKSDE